MWYIHRDVDSDVEPAEQPGIYEYLEYGIYESLEAPLWWRWRWRWRCHSSHHHQHYCSHSLPDVKGRWVKKKRVDVKQASMISLSWNRPSAKHQEEVLACCKDGDFNYDPIHKGATRESPLSSEHVEKLRKDGYAINYASVKLGSGGDAFLKGKDLLQNWEHFQLPWASVEPSTKVKEGGKFCVCSREMVAWIINPLQILYVDSADPPACAISKTFSKAAHQQAAFAYGSGTLQGHLLAGEERFGVEWREDDSVWYEIVSFSKPAHFLSVAGYPVARFKQKLFAKQSTDAMIRAIRAVAAPTIKT